MTVLEITRLRVASDDAGALLDARAGMLAAFRERPGFLRAELVELADGEWLDLIEWRTSEDFAESRRRGADSEGVRLFFDSIESVVRMEEGVIRDHGLRAPDTDAA